MKYAQCTQGGGNKRKPFFKFLALLLVHVDMVQVIKARIIFLVSVFPPLFALLFSFFLLTRKTYWRFKPPNNASQIRWFRLVAFIVHTSSTHQAIQLLVIKHIGRINLNNIYYLTTPIPKMMLLNTVQFFKLEILWIVLCTYYDIIFLYSFIHFVTCRYDVA